MTNSELKEKIRKLKSETDTFILAHYYQRPEVLDVADFAGDTLSLVRAVRRTGNKRVLICGVRFMAEMAKLASPEKDVLLSNPLATCPMANQIHPGRIRAFREDNPGVCVAAYINTSAELKAESDICVTTSTALELCRRIEQHDILFIPDKNLGGYVQRMLPEKNVMLWDCCCPIHNRVTEKDVRLAAELWKSAKIAAHRGCPEEVTQMADFVGTAGEIYDYCENCGEEVIIAAERGIADRLEQLYPERVFHRLVPDKLVCGNMKTTTLESVCRALEGDNGTYVKISKGAEQKARERVETLLSFGESE